jgi:stress-induced morphogen
LLCRCRSGATSFAVGVVFRTFTRLKTVHQSRIVNASNYLMSQKPIWCHKLCFAR